MARPSRQTIVVAGVLLAGGAWAWLLIGRSGPRAVEAGFWFEPVRFSSTVLGGSLTPGELETIRSIATSEIRHAFDGLPVTVSDRRDAEYRVRVVPELRNPRLRAPYEVAGASYGLPGIGGWGEVSFRFLAGGAVAYAQPDAARESIVAAIGRGIGRSAVHELTHQLLPRTQIHGRDVRSYEYDSASRREQYDGDIHWDVAWPLLRERFGSAALDPTRRSH